MSKEKQNLTMYKGGKIGYRRLDPQSRSTHSVLQTGGTSPIFQPSETNDSRELLIPMNYVEFVNYNKVSQYI